MIDLAKWFRPERPSKAEVVNTEMQRNAALRELKNKRKELNEVLNRSLDEVTQPKGRSND